MISPRRPGSVGLVGGGAMAAAGKRSFPAVRGPPPWFQVTSEWAVGCAPPHPCAGASPVLQLSALCKEKPVKSASNSVSNTALCTYPKGAATLDQCGDLYIIRIGGGLTGQMPIIK